MRESYGPSVRSGTISLVRHAAEVDEIRRLAGLGEPAAAIARKLGIPRSTVRAGSTGRNTAAHDRARVWPT